MEVSQNVSSHVLPEGITLPHNYIIKGILGEGGFGITYIGFNTITSEKVAIKEYFPTGMATREFRNGEYLVIPFQGALSDTFEKGRQHFLNEASILKEFHHLNSIVSVKDVIETNGTVYLVMEYIDGITLKQYVKENGSLTFDELLPLMKPVIQALIQVHKRGLIHRDISPDNLMIGIDNQLHLIDFGAASFDNTHDSKTMTVILKSGYAPPEQYLSDGKQGAWTDIYALCSTMYLALTGFAPPESIKRMQRDELPSLAANAVITSWQAEAITKGINLSPADRYQNMETLYQALIIPPIEADSKREAYQAASLEENKTVITHPIPKQKLRRRIIAGLLVVLLFVLIFNKNNLPEMALSSLSGNHSTPANLSSDENAATPKEASDSICSMIDMVGSSLADARKSLSQLDSSIQIQTEWVYDNKEAANTIIDQSIESGTSFTKGSIGSILLTVSRGKEPTTESNSQQASKNEQGKTGSSSTEQSSTGQSNTHKNDSPDNQTATSKNSTEQSNYDVSPIDDDYDSFTID